MSVAKHVLREHPLRRDTDGAGAINRRSEEVLGRLIVVLCLAESGGSLHELAEFCFGKSAEPAVPLSLCQRTFAAEDELPIRRVVEKIVA